MDGMTSGATDAMRTDEGLISSKKIDGTPVFDKRGERLGTVDSFMVGKRSGQVAYAVMSFGGFLGIGDHYHPLPWQALSFDAAQGGYVVDLDKGKLEGAPTYKEGDLPFEADESFCRRVFEHYGMAYAYGGL